MFIFSPGKCLVFKCIALFLYSETVKTVLLRGSCGRQDNFQMQGKLFWSYGFLMFLMLSNKIYLQSPLLWHRMNKVFVNSVFFSWWFIKESVQINLEGIPDIYCVNIYIFYFFRLEFKKCVYTWTHPMNTIIAISNTQNQAFMINLLYYFLKKLFPCQQLCNVFIDQCLFSIPNFCI